MANEIHSKTIAATYGKLLITKSDSGFSGSSAGNERVIATDDKDGSITESCLAVGTARVGIGTASPSASLHVASGVANIFAGYLADTTGTSGQSYGLDIQAGTTSGDMSFRVRDYAGNTDFIILGDGNVGIGTATPGSLLEVRGGTGGGLPGGAGILTLSTGEVDHIVDGDVLGLISFSAPVETSGSDAILPACAIWAEAEDDFDANTNSASLVFAAATTSTAHHSSVERMRITYEGNVGIGTSSPGSPLHVQIASAEATVARFQTTNAAMTIGEDSDNANFIVMRPVTGEGIIISNDGDAVGLCVEDTNGYVGIGTSSPYKPLDVSSTSGIAISNTDFNNTNTGTRILIETGATSGNTYGEIHVQDEGGGSNNNLALLPNGGNVGIGTSTFDGSAVGYLAIKNGTEPSAHTDNQIYIGSKDASTSSESTLAIFCEEDPVAHDSGGAYTNSHKMKIWINGTEYWIVLDAV